MGRFYKKMIVFIGLFVILLLGVDFLSMQESWRWVLAGWTNSEEFINVNVGPSEIMPKIEKVRDEGAGNILIVGDSVCNQIFKGLQDFNNEICIAGSNAAITMSGQYILVNEYLVNHPDATDVYLFVLPNALRSTYDTSWGYQYTVMPFVLTDTIQLLDKNTLQIMEEVYGSFFMKKGIVDAIDCSGINRKIYLNLLRKNSSGYEQKSTFEIADQYIKKMFDLCESKGVELHLSSCPVAEGSREVMMDLKGDYQQSWLYSQYPEYMEDIIYYPDKETKDGVHFGGDAASQENYNDKIRQMIAGMELEDALRYE